ncbi:FAD-dependent oxidoreductase [Methylocella sp.]|uniref:FAD-dependent oxidoreductase n=1 Tax=Methylocella sp. TaxID=1978226 RepID=UPI0037834E69
MSERDVDHLLLGGGPAAATAAETLRLEGASSSILMVSADDRPPYFRPTLSKQLLSGAFSADKILLHPESFYAEQKIELALRTQIVALDPARRAARTAAGDEIGYKSLLIATGARPVRLDLPGADRPNVHHLRTAADCEAARRQIEAGAKSAVVVGGSFLASEIAMTLVELGLSVTIVERRKRILKQLEAPDVSAFIERHMEARGVRLICDETVTRLVGADRIEAVETSGGRSLPCDLVMVAIGVVPETGFLKGSGLDLDDGLVIVDDQLRASAPGVYAAGDVTSFADPVFARRRHIEHWDNAVRQGRLAARNMLGRRLRYDEVSYFFCDVGDISFNMLGAPEEANEKIARGSLDDKSFALFYLKDDVPRALFTSGRPAQETRDVEAMIRYRINLAEVKPKLPDPAFALDSLPNQTVLVLQGGGALGAFECGVVKALEEEKIFPDVVAGISIGALNGAIVAGNPRHATQALEAFWSDLAVSQPFGVSDATARAVASMQTLAFGLPNFFKPRWLPGLFETPTPPTNWTSFYDVAPMRALIARYVDFSKLSVSPVRLLIGAVNVKTAQLEVFDSYVDALTPDHVLASGSLPPGFPWTMIDGEAYWDGGVVSNSPLDLVNDRCGPDGKRVFVVDLFAEEKPLPANMVEVMTRRDEIVYSERVRSDIRTRELVGAYRALVKGMLDAVDPATREKIVHRPLYIQLMGDGGATTVTRFVRKGRSGEPSSRDYDFSESSIRFAEATGRCAYRRSSAGAGQRFPARRGDSGGPGTSYARAFSAFSKDELNAPFNAEDLSYD